MKGKVHDYSKGRRSRVNVVTSDVLLCEVPSLVISPKLEHLVTKL